MKSIALQILRERANINSACDDTDFRSGIYFVHARAADKLHPLTTIIRE